MYVDSHRQYVNSIHKDGVSRSRNINKIIHYLFVDRDISSIISHMRIWSKNILNLWLGIETCTNVSPKLSKCTDLLLEAGGYGINLLAFFSVFFMQSLYPNFGRYTGLFPSVISSYSNYLGALSSLILTTYTITPS